MTKYTLKGNIGIRDNDAAAFAGLINEEDRNIILPGRAYVLTERIRLAIVKILITYIEVIRLEYADY
jgi:hypothetical protein